MQCCSTLCKEQAQREGGRSTLPLISTLRTDHGFNPTAAKVLTGTYTDYDVPTDIATFFSMITRTPTERDLPPVLGTITSADFQSMFRNAKERTSSDPRTLNYTIWKCLSRSDRVSSFACILLSLPFTYGFVNTHWTHMTDFMLEKKPGVRQIHTLRIIGKVAAEFNTCLKFLIGKQARNNFERANPCDDQHGFRPHRSSADAAMIKLLTFECARMQKATVGSFQNDMTGHFDRMWPDLTSVIATKYGVSRTIMTCLSRTIAKLERNVETALGISTQSYSQGSSASRLGGMVQGKADVPQLSTQQMDVMLKTHRQLAPGLHLTSPSLGRSIRRTCLSYADDTDGQVSVDTDGLTSLSDLIELLRVNAQTWSNIADMCGGLIALHKCNWQLLAWEQKSGHLSLVTTAPDPLTMRDCHGSATTITFLPPDLPNVGLGFHLCPNGDQRPQFATLLAAINRLCRSVAGANLSENETRTLLQQRLIPKLSYALHGSSFSEQQCHKLNSVIRSSLLPGMRFNRHFPSAILYGPTDYGGMEFPEIYTLQDQIQLEYLLKQLRWGQTVANDFMVTLDSVQLCSGYCRPLLESVSDTVDYLEPSYILDLRRRLAELGADIWIEHAWCPQLQREGDSSLMEAFNNIPGITRAKLRQANSVRLYLRVVTVADLCDVQGTHIRDGMLQGDWQAGSDFKWPYQPRPPKPFWATFRWCLRQTFCTSTCPNQPASYSMKLDSPLTRWFAVPRNTWFPAYRLEDKLFWRQRNDQTLNVLTPSATSGFYHHSGTTTLLPLASHPIIYQQVGESIWTQRPYLAPLATHTPIPPGHVVANMLCHPRNEVITVGSDGSVYLNQQIATCAWMICDDVGNSLSACFLLSGISSLSSYRSELEGIFRSLKHIEFLGMSASEINMWCDNEAAVDKCSGSLWSPKQMIQPEADILLAIHAIRQYFSSSGTQVTCRHIYAHQDTRRRPHPAVLDSDSRSMEDPLSHTATTPIANERLDLPTRINIACDRLATETSMAVLEEGTPPLMPPTLDGPLPGSVAVLRIANKCITSHQKRHIFWERRAHHLRDYCMEKYRWDEETFLSVDWGLIRRIRRRCTPTQRMHTSKILHGWLPVMHMLAHMSGNTQCPGCPHPDETFEHLVHCPHPLLQAKREEIIAALRKKGLKLRAPRALLDFLVSTILGSGSHINDDDGTSPLHRALASQKRIGLLMTLRGFLATEWTTYLRSCGLSYPSRTMAWILRFLWFDSFDALWRIRNDILHRQQNDYSNLEDSRLQERLHWFLDNNTSISRRDHFLLRFSHQDVHLLPHRTKKELARLLTRAMDIHSKELLLLDKGQTRITDFFQLHTTT